MLQEAGQKSVRCAVAARVLLILCACWFNFTTSPCFRMIMALSNGRRCLRVEEGVNCAEKDSRKHFSSVIAQSQLGIHQA